MAQSVDVDRREDSYLRTLLPEFRRAGLATTVRGIREACAAARAAGLAVFPPCDHTDERGRCLGHAGRGEP